MPDLWDISKSLCNEYLQGIIYDKNHTDTWKYRFHYMWLNKELIFSSFMLTTIVKYMINPIVHRIFKYTKVTINGHKKV